MEVKNYYKTIVVSDIHLGTSGSKAKEVTQFLKENRCQNLILNGDIIDGWQLGRYGSWKKKHTSFIRLILKLIEKYNVKVIYVRGNHDDFLDEVIPFQISPNFKIVKDLILKTGSKKFFVTHGDVFDLVTKKAKWIAHIGDLGYTLLLWINKRYNQYRKVRGLQYYSVSSKVKQSIKAAINYISDYEIQLAELAKSKDCQGIICGHIHQAAVKEINGVLYLNSGDWVESMTALVEDFEGNWKLIQYLENYNYDTETEEIMESHYVFNT